MLRDFTLEDVLKLKAFWEKGDKHFPFPEISHPLYVIRKAILSDTGKVIGCAFVRLTSETILVMNDEEPRATKMKGISEALENLDNELLKIGLNDTHAFVCPEEDPEIQKYARLLKKKFGFEDATGIPLYRSALREGKKNGETANKASSQHG